MTGANTMNGPRSRVVLPHLEPGETAVEKLALERDQWEAKYKDLGIEFDALKAENAHLRTTLEDIAKRIARESKQ